MQRSHLGGLQPPVAVMHRRYGTLFLYLLGALMFAFLAVDESAVWEMEALQRRYRHVWT